MSIIVVKTLFGIEQIKDFLTLKSMLSQITTTC